MNLFQLELPKNLIMFIKNCIVQVGLGNVRSELTSVDLDLEKIPAEHQFKFITENSEKGYLKLIIEQFNRRSM